jgi:putative hydrolase of HD superfamily
MTDARDRIVDFLFETGMLKRTPRSGWAFLPGAPTETVAEHSFRTVWVALVLASLDGTVDADRVARMALVHDLPEARTSDLNYVHQKYVAADERAAARDQMAGLPFGDELVELLEELEARESPEARIVRDADQLEMLLTLREAEAGGARQARDWMPAVVGRLHTDTARDLGRRIMEGDPSRWWFAEPGSDWWIRGGKG